jgi:transcriptional regulator with XRE-family HTH domain
MGDHRVHGDYNYDLGNHLLILRTRIALTQIALAEQIGVHRRSVQKWETGLSYPKAEMLQRLIAVLLLHHAFMPGNEREEALALWEQATRDGSHPLPAFDEGWFARTLAQNDQRGTQNDEPRSILLENSAPSFITHRPSLIDWARRLPSPRCMAVTASLQRCTNGSWMITAG